MAAKINRVKGTAFRRVAASGQKVASVVGFTLRRTGSYPIPAKSYSGSNLCWGNISTKSTS